MISQRTIFLSLAGLLGVTTTGGEPAAPAPVAKIATPQAVEGVRLYAADPNHLWNRLHEALHVRTDKNGAQFGEDTLDPLLWTGSTHLLTGKSQAKALGALDEFIATHGEKLVADPLRKALLQRDLWAVFDWAAKTYEEKENEAGAERLLIRLAIVLNRLELTRKEIESLPDNYKDAVRSYPADFDPGQPEKPFLPHDLFDESGPWVAVGDSVYSPAKIHARAFGDRSTFTVFINLPGGRAATLAWIAQWAKEAADKGDWGKVVFPEELPAGTRFALVRRALFISTEGLPVASRLVESIQMRMTPAIKTPEATANRLFAPFEFTLRRHALLEGRVGGLHAVGPEETDFTFVQFFSHGVDPFEELHENPVKSTLLKPLNTCFACHNVSGLRLASYEFTEKQVRLEPFLPLTMKSVEREQEWYKRASRPDWALLRGLWMAKRPE